VGFGCPSGIGLSMKHVFRAPLCIVPARSRYEIMNTVPDRRNTVSPARLLRVAVVQTEMTIREGLRWHLGGLPEVERVKTYEDMRGLVDEDSLWSPHVAVIERGVNARQMRCWLARIRVAIPGARCLVYAESTPIVEVVELLQGGVAGFVLSSDSRAFLHDAVLSVARGGMPVSPQLTRQLMEVFVGPPWTATPAPRADLSNRERELIEGLSRGLRYQDLAVQMGVSIETVRTHVRRTYAKLRVNSRTEAVAKFVRTCEIDRTPLRPAA
jgi:DNA-binding NarL/FixJ family response regulator